uniref:Tetratricopeptide repeat protein 21B n=1 Tax=Bursaphelenchus xylophilus TaxID=6326 RepID=A0A1I7RZM2_BURXY
MINYYIRNNFFGSAATLCDDSLKRVKDQRQIQILKAYCLTKIGKVADAIRILNGLTDEPDLELAVYNALKIAYNSESVVDKDSVRNAEEKAQNAWAKSHDRGAFLCGTIYMFEKSYERAKPLIDRVANSNTHNAICLAQKGWLEVLWGRDLNLATKKFEAAIETDNNPDGYLGKIKLLQTRRFADKALQIRETEEAIALKSELLLETGNTKEAIKTAIGAVESHNLAIPDPLFSLIRCYMADNKMKDAKTQLEFVKVSFSEIEKNTMYMYLNALVENEKSPNKEGFLGAVRNVIDHHMGNVHGLPYGLEYLKALNATFIMEIVQKLFEYVPLSPSNIPDPVLKEIERNLLVLHDNFPAVAKLSYLLAKVKYLHLDNDGAQAYLKNAIDRNNNIAEAHLLMAQIHLQKNNLEEASKCLDIGLGFNFKVRDHPLFYLIKSRFLRKEKKLEEAIMMMKSAFDLQAFQDNDASLDRLEVTESDRIQIILELIDLLQQVGQTREADQVMQQAVQRYHGKAEEHQLVLMNAQLRLQRGDVDGAIKVLDTIKPDDPNYNAARMKMAQIYLENKQDRIRFAQCYKSILDKNPSPQTYVLLGDAYMSIQEPTNAIDAYETAMRRSPNDYELAVKIGDAYVKCHLYNKAINFYEAAMKKSKQPLLRLRFAEQLLRLGNMEKCERVLRDVIDESLEPDSFQELHDHVGFWALLSRMHSESNNVGLAITAQEKARTLQNKILALKDIPNIQAERRAAAETSAKLAELYARRREHAKAVDLYKEAIFINERELRMIPNPEPDSLEHFHLQIMIKLARIYMTMGKLQQCHQQCHAILNLDRNNNEATLMLADLMYQRNEGETALKHFSQLLDRNPTHYHALARYIELGWRKGDLEQVEKYVKNALEHNPRATTDAGFNYCKGLIEWYSGEPNSALQAFNRARRDLEWGERSLVNMIEICMNPDNELIGGETFEHDDAAARGESKEIAVKTADRFLKELKNKRLNNSKHELLSNFIQLASGNKMNIQASLDSFLEILGADFTNPNGPEVVNVGAVLGAARAYMLLKQTQKAKQYLKRVHSYPWNLEDSDYLQQCWLLLADIYINQGKTDQATAVLRTVLQYNASATKAYEYMGFLREKEQKYADAAANYELAWRLCRQRNPAVGYKLAYNYLKCRRLFDCIDVCHAVLRLVPEYPKVKRDIMDKARSMIKM